MDSSTLIVFVVVLFAAFTESLSGFGSALVAMAFLPALLGMQEAAAFVALFSLPLEIVLSLYYRSAIQWRAVGRIIAASVVGIPVGMFVLRNADEKIVLTGLGIILVGYALYSLLNLRLPKFRNPNWGWGFGFVAGILGGAYNTSGPPVVIYGQTQDWNPDEFRGNVLSFFVVNSALVAAGHALSGNYSAALWNDVLIAIPALALGIVAGLTLDRYINPLRFRQIVQVLLIVLGLRLIFA